MITGKYSTYKSTCSYCGVGCGLEVKKDCKGKIEVTGDSDHPVNGGMLCSKGMNLHYTMMDHADRLLYPQMRWNRYSELKRVDWQTAIKRAAAVFKSIIANHGPDSVAFYVSGQCLTEEYYLVNKLAKGYIGTNNVDTNSRLCMSSAVAAYAQMLGEDAPPFSYRDIELADCFVIAGANPAWCHPILFRRIEARKAADPGVKIIVIDPRKTQTCSNADLHLQINPGSDIYVYNAIGKLLIQNGAIDYEFVQNHVEGFEAYKKSVMPLRIEEAAAICGVEEHEIIKAAQFIADSNAMLTMWAMGLNQSVIGVEKNKALISLNLITGQIGKPGGGPFSLTGQPNAMGGREVGGMATLLPAHRKLADPAARREVADFWGVDKIPSIPGMTATEMIDGLEAGRLKAIWIICTNPLVSLPNLNRVESALQKAKFVIVQDISSSADTLQYADLVLPGAGHFEKEGTMTNSERRISYLSKVIEAPGEALPDGDILIRFAREMGFAGFDFKNPSEVFNEHCQLTKGTNTDISHLSYDKLKRQGTMQWPVTAARPNGTERLFEDKKFYTLTGKAQLFPLSQPANRSAMPTEAFPLILTTGRIRDQWHTMTKTKKVSKLNQHIDKPFLEIHPDDALVRNISNGEMVTICNDNGQVTVGAKVTGNIKKGVVFLPMHWGKVLKNTSGRANNLTSDLIDPTSKEPDFKFAAVQVRKFAKVREKIIVVGAGAAAYRFIMSYRERNRLDEIQVFSNEPYPFYNRVLLPEYINGHFDWEKLLKIHHGQLEKMDIDLRNNCGIISINKVDKWVEDNNGARHQYDKLILATGSRAFVPKDAPMGLPNIFTMRMRHDADSLREKLHPGASVLIIGGGLLGLELAAALREMDIQISIVQLGGRLMERQIDALAGQLLLEIADEKDINVYLNDQVQHITLEENRLKAQLRSGAELRADAIVYAVGTRPNIEFASGAGLESGRGLIVNDHLQTNDEHIFAIGEIAEHRGRLYGITSAAEQQADIVANYLQGDIFAVYKGSVLMNILKFSDFDLCSIGLSEIPVNQDGYDEILFIDKSMRYYKKCIIKDDRLVGAILVGDKTEFAEFKNLIENKIELSERRMELLRSGKKGESLLGPVVCTCNNVGKGNLQGKIDAGINSLNALCQATGAGLGCGSCKPEIQEMLQQSNEMVAV
ncbi:MAG: molybdopterin-dependent oxidoreductase [Cyclobacteriaceae bacterium]|nr:molybdopterin-dependent oxidoreductase [Cyclobacteriaceae bacterium]